MAKITLFWCFEKKIFLSRMMEFQVKFCHHSELRLWRTGMLFSTKYKCRKSNFRISWMCRYCFYDLKVYFWYLIRDLKFDNSCLNTLYLGPIYVLLRVANWQAFYISIFLFNSLWINPWKKTTISEQTGRTRGWSRRLSSGMPQKVRLVQMVQ